MAALQTYMGVALATLERREQETDSLRATLREDCIHEYLRKDVLR
jgi:hypothetical protein